MRALSDVKANNKSYWDLASNHTKEENIVASHQGINNLMAIASLVALIVIGFAFESYTHPAKHATKPKSEVIARVNRPAVHRKVITPKQRHGFINQVGYPAVQAFKRGHYQVLPSIVIAQAIVESEWGTSGLSSQGHNLFGVKGAYRGKSVNMPTAEYVNGRKVHVNANFRAYPSLEASLADHAQLLQDKFIGKSHDLNYHDVAYRIKAHGYATDPSYPQKLINTINTYHLYRYDKIGLK